MKLPLSLSLFTHPCKKHYTLLSDLVMPKKKIKVSNFLFSFSSDMWVIQIFTDQEGGNVRLLVEFDPERKCEEKGIYG
jgi:hypothetical protein